MDYIGQLNAFDNWLEYNELGAGPQLLWYKLMAIANKSGWQSELSIANTRLQAMTKTSEKTLINNRNQLIQNGLLQYKKRGRTKAGIYLITDLTGNFTAKKKVIDTVENPTTGNITVNSKVNPKVNNVY
ncbi:Replication initiation and membrane attachment [Enterococcus durans]|uniref:Replication initiation and membrane attachment n=1 Tax=Enterococcus durans TaxID=53345 RepID=A0A377KMD4_9ENTE|nr:Replication initiation and membrane attachment [Enterococcus durans]